jgi:hypothetical protein
MVSSVVAWHCSRCGVEVDPQYHRKSAVVCRECNRIVCRGCCRGCLAVRPTRKLNYAVCRSCAGSVVESEGDEAKGWRAIWARVVERIKQWL